MAAPAEGVAFLSRGLNDLAVAIVYAYRDVWSKEYGIVRDVEVVCFVECISRTTLRWHSATRALTTRVLF